MAGKPRRKRPKVDLQVFVEERDYSAVLPLIDCSQCKFTSFSQLLETIIFLSQHMYIEEPDDSFVAKLFELKSARALACLKNKMNSNLRRVHATIDRDALRFIDMLVSRYRMLFSSRSEVVGLLLGNIGKECTSLEDIHYYCNRLLEVLLLHPYRKS